MRILCSSGLTFQLGVPIRVSKWFCFYGLFKRLLNRIGLHWSQDSVEETSSLTGGETRHGNEYLDVHEAVI